MGHMFVPKTGQCFGNGIFIRVKIIGQAYRERQDVFLFSRLLNDGHSAMLLDVVLHNTGTATARDVYIVIKTPHGLDYNKGPDWRMGSNPQGQAALQATRNFHPGESTALCTMSMQETFRVSPAAPGSSDLLPHFEKIAIRFLIYAEGAARQEMEVAFFRADLSYEAGSATKDAVPVS